ncbi:MAG: type II secretion system F family protein [Candidatus Hydrogenedentes bacterium]|nr:type II secretion system F family protein [Candidatus Hydrogenedentota bacterium]
MNWKEILQRDVSLLWGGKRPIHERYERRGKKWKGHFYRRKAAWQRDLLVVTSQLSAIARCNAPLVDGLSYAAASAPNAKVQNILLAVRSGITKGQGLSESMGSLPRFFPRYYVDIVKSGEDTGALSESFYSLTSLVHQTHAATQTIRGWVTYLTFLLCAQCFILAFLFAFIVPQFVEVLRDFGATAPEPVRTLGSFYQALVGPVAYSGRKGLEGLFNLGNDVQVISPILVFRLSLPVSLLVAFLMLRYQPFWSARRSGRREWLRRCFRWIPVWRHIDAKLTLSHIAAVLRQLLASGMPMDKALVACTELDIGPRFRGVMSRLLDRVRKGTSLSDAMKDERGLPDSLRTMVALGETSGLLPESLERISSMYERQALTSARVVADIVAPLVVIVAGCATLLVTLSVHMSLVGIIDAVLDSI